MAYLHKNHPISKLLGEILAINHCVALHPVVDEGFNFFFISFEKGRQFKLVLENDFELSLVDDRNKTLMPKKKYSGPKDIKKMAYDVLGYLI